MPFVSVGDLMKKPAVVVNTNESVADAYRIMHLNNFRHVPVVNEEFELVGIVSDRDILRAALSEDALGSHLSDQLLLLQDHPVTEVMSADPEAVDIDTPLGQACQIMVDNKFDSLPVVEAGRLVGIMTSSDVLQVVAQWDLGAG